MNSIITCLAAITIMQCSLASQTIAQDQERMPFDAPSVEERLSEFDINGDGDVTLSELQEVLDARFEELDADNNGLITLDVLPKILPLSQKQEQRINSRIARTLQHAEKRGIPIDEGVLKNRFQQTRVRFLARNDSDLDEAVSEQEFQAKPLRAFQHADADENEVITAAEVSAMAAKANRNRRARRGGCGPMRRPCKD